MTETIEVDSAPNMMAITDPAEARAIIRRGHHVGHTVGIAPDYVQGNVCILPRDDALEFATFCQRNPKPCPVIGIGAPGDPALPTLGDIDIRTDVPKYRVFRDGELVEERVDIVELWRDDLVTFILGCSFSFELPLLQEGISLQHIDRNTEVPMYRTSIACVAAGKFSSDMVVSMRPLHPADAIRAIQITSRYRAVHGAPVHIGSPDAIGIKDIMTPDFGDPPVIEHGQLPVFWACGVTPQIAVEQARPSICVTHKPAAMLITDKKNNELAAL